MGGQEHAHIVRENFGTGSHAHYLDRVCVHDRITCMIENCPSRVVGRVETVAVPLTIKYGVPS